MLSIVQPGSGSSNLSERGVRYFSVGMGLEAAPSPFNTPLHRRYIENVETETDAKMTEKLENREFQFLSCYFSLSVAAGHGLQ